MKINKEIQVVIMLVLVAVMLIISTTSALAFKTTKNSYQDGFNRGVRDARCDFFECHGHGFDPHCPSGHSRIFCEGYSVGYHETWNNLKDSGRSSSSSSSCATASAGSASSSACAAASG